MSDSGFYTPCVKRIMVHRRKRNSSRKFVTTAHVDKYWHGKDVASVRITTLIVDIWVFFALFFTILLFFFHNSFITSNQVHDKIWNSDRFWFIFHWQRIQNLTQLKSQFPNECTLQITSTFPVGLSMTLLNGTTSDNETSGVARSRRSMANLKMGEHIGNWITALMASGCDMEWGQG